MWGGNGREESISSKRSQHGGSEHPVPKLDLHLAAEGDGGDKHHLAQTSRDEVKFPLLTPRRDGTRGSKTARKGKSTSRSHTGRDVAKDLASKAMSKHLARIPYWKRRVDLQHRTEAEKAAAMTIDEILERGTGGAIMFRDDLLEMRDAQSYGVLAYEMRAANVQRVRCFSKMQPFRFKINFEEQTMRRYECSVWGAENWGTQQCSGEWSIKGASFARASSIRGVPVVGIPPGTAFIVTTVRPGGDSSICLCCDTTAEVDAFEKMLLLGANRVEYLHKKMGKARGAGDGDEGIVDGVGETSKEQQKYHIGISDKREMCNLVQNPTKMRTLVTAGLLQLNGDSGKSSIWHSGQGSVSDGLALAIARHFKTTEERRSVIEKVKLAGATTEAELVKLIESPAPPEASFLPRWADFRGRPCQLNYRIDVNNAKLLKSKTLDSLYRLLQLPLDVEAGYLQASQSFKERETNDSKLLRELVTQIFSQSIPSREAVMRKLFFAGAKSINELGHLIQTPAPKGHCFPKHALFQGKTTMLNYMIDRGGNKLLGTSTLHQLYEGYLFHVTQQHWIKKHRAAIEAYNSTVPPSDAWRRRGSQRNVRGAVSVRPDPLMHLNIPEHGRGTTEAGQNPTSQKFKSMNSQKKQAVDKFVFSDPFMRVPIRGIATCIAFSSAGDMLAVGTLEGSIILISCLGSKKPGDAGQRGGRSPDVRSPGGADSPDGRGTTSRASSSVGSPLGDVNGNVEEWRVVGELKRHTGTINSIHFRTPVGETFFPALMMASGSDDGCVCVWDCDGLHAADRAEQRRAANKRLPGQRCFKTFGNRGRRVLCVKFSPDGSKLASATDEGDCRLFDVLCWNTMPGFIRGVRSLTPVKDNSWTMDYVLGGHTRAINAVAFGEYLSVIGTGSADKTVRLWEFDGEADAWTCTHVIEMPLPVASLNFDPDSPSIVVSCVGDDRAYAWDVEKMQEKLEPWEYQIMDCGDDGDELICASAAIRGPKSFVAIGLDDSTVRIFAPKATRRRGLVGKYRQVGRLVCEENPNCMGTSVDARFLAMSGDDSNEQSESTGEPSSETDIITIWELGDALRYIRDKGNTNLDSMNVASLSRASSSGELPPNRMHDGITPLPTPPSGVRPRAAAARPRFVGDGGNTPKTARPTDDDARTDPMTSKTSRESLIMTSPKLGSTDARSVREVSVRSAMSARSDASSIKMQAGEVMAGSSSSEGSLSSDDERTTTEPSLVISKVQQIVERNTVWVDEVVRGLRVWLGNDAFFQFFEPGWSGKPLPEIVAGRAATCLASLAKSRMDTSGIEDSSLSISKNIQEVIGEREDCQKSERIAQRSHRQAVYTSGGRNRKALLSDVVLSLSSESSSQEKVAKESWAAAMFASKVGAGKLHPERAAQMMPMVVDWLLSWPKLFEVIWCAYVFNKLFKNKCHKSMMIMEAGQVLEKVEETEFQMPTSALLSPHARRGTKPTTEIEFQIERTYEPEEGQESLRVGICTGQHDIMKGEDAGSSPGGWMFGCGSGMKFHKGQAQVYTNRKAGIGDKVGVILDFGKATMSIQINGANQGIMYSGLPVHQKLYFVVDLTLKGERVRIPDVMVRNGWTANPKRVVVDPLEFVHS